jgi:CBS domain containing-hemolysin-like protein
MVDLAEERQVIESREREMIHSVFELGETIAREVMVPRTDMVWIEQGKSVRQALSLALRSGFSRIPVIGTNEDDVVGVAYLKDLARKAYDADAATAGKVVDLMRPAYFIPDSKPVDELLREMQAKQVHVAIVIDEYGGTAGLVTIEDILEEIVGEIADEYDREAPRVEKLSDGRIRVNVRLPVDDLEEMFGVAFELEDVETVGGLLAAELGRVPIPGATVTAQGLTFTAEGAKGRRKQIGTVLISRGVGASAADPA